MKRCRYAGSAVGKGSDARINLTVDVAVGEDKGADVLLRDVLHQRQRCQRYHTGLIRLILRVLRGILDD